MTDFEDTLRSRLTAAAAVQGVPAGFAEFVDRRAHRRLRNDRAFRVFAPAIVVAVAAAGLAVGRTADTQTATVPSVDEAGPASTSIATLDDPDPTPTSASAHVPDLTPTQRAAVEAAVTASPSHWKFGFTATPSGLAIEGTADDGDGPSRLFIGIQEVPGHSIRNPCSDATFSAQASCRESLLADGSVLAIRGEVNDSGIVTVVAAVSRPDRTGVFLESANYTSPNGPTPPTGRLRPSRARPAYTPEMLGEVAVAVAEATVPGG